MKYLLRQKLLAIGDDYTIKDENGNDAYFIDGKVFVLRDTLVFKDLSGNKLCTIQKKMVEAILRDTANRLLPPGPDIP